MKIRSITLNNYRLYRGVNTISFEPDRDKNIYLISGENGFGKTTFLHSLIWCLYGRLSADVEDSVKKDINSNGYNTILRTNLNNSVKQELEGYDDAIINAVKKNGYNIDTENIKQLSNYSVSIEFSEVVIPSIPCNSLRITRSFDYIFDKESIEILIDGAANELTNEIGPEIFINDFILNKDIARFFFFDSEKIVSLAETATTTERKKLCSAYNEVLGVRKYEELKKNLENLRLRFRRKSADVESRNKLNALIESQERLKKEELSNTEDIASFSEKLAGLRAEDEALQLQLMREGNGMTIEELHKMQKVLEITKDKDIAYKKQLKTFLEYAPFAISGSLFSKAKQLYESDYKVSVSNDQIDNRNELVSEITSELLIMLGKAKINKEQSVELQMSIQNILGKFKTEATSETSLFHPSENDYNEFVSIYNYITSTYKAEFERLAEDYKKNKQAMERFTRKISNMQNNESDLLIKNIRAKKNDIEKLLKETEANIQQLHVNQGMIAQQLSSITKKITELSKKVSIDDSDAKKDSVAEALIGELAVFLTSLKEEKKYSLERRIKVILNTLMHKEDFIGRVEVEINGEEMDINLYRPDDTLINKDSLSKGEQQLYATSILKALVDESEIQFPVFIDSPLQKFDKTHAERIISEFYPSVSKQVVLFPLLYKELTKTEYDIMQPLVKSVHLIKNDTLKSYFKSIPVDQLI